MKLHNAEIALAMELRQEGCTWTRIAWMFSVDPGWLSRVVRKAEREGMKQINLK